MTYYGVLPKAGLSGTELEEVAGGLGDDVFAENHHDTARRLIADGDVEIHFRVGPTV